jgi:Spy/CpxP family protein refolding chaperone
MTRAAIVASAVLIGATCAGADVLAMEATGHEPLAQARREARAMRHRGARDHASLERLLAAAEELDLSNTQIDKLRAIRRNAPGVLMPKRQAVQEARIDLADLMARKDASAGDLRNAHERLVQARGAVASAMFDLRMQAREVLTEQQREKLREGLRKAGRRPMRQGALPPPGTFEPFDEIDGLGALDLDGLDGFDLDAPLPPDAVAPGDAASPEGTSDS